MFDYYILTNMADNFHDEEGRPLMVDFAVTPAGEREGLEDNEEGLFWIKIGEGEEFLDSDALYQKYVPEALPGEYFALFVYDPLVNKVREAAYTDEGLNRTLDMIRRIALRNTDFIFLEDTPISGEEKDEWRVFRQELRDIMSQPKENRIKMMKREVDAWPEAPDPDIAWLDLNGPNPFTDIGLRLLRQISIFGEAEREQ